MTREHIIDIVCKNIVFNKHDNVIHIAGERIAEQILKEVENETKNLVAEEIEKFRQNNKLKISLGGGKTIELE